jgi:hypothetical protein
LPPRPYRSYFAEPAPLPAADPGLLAEPAPLPVIAEPAPLPVIAEPAPLPVPGGLAWG